MFKKKFIALLLLCYVFSLLLTGCGSEAKKPWDEVTSYVCYYGSFNKDMKKFDVAILESANLKKSEIKELNKAGVYTIAYLSIGEEKGLNKGKGNGPGGYASYYFADSDGKPVQNANWGSYYTNASDPDWQERVISLAKEIIDKGCDGLLLDTIDTVDLYPDTFDGMVELIKKLHDTYPDIKLVANRGFSVLSAISPYISGVMYESFTSHYDFLNKDYAKQLPSQIKTSGNLGAYTINMARKINNFKVFALDYALPESKDDIQLYYDRAWEYDFVPYVSTILLDNVYVHDITPQSERGIKKDIGENAVWIDDPKMPPPNTDPNNIALASNGAVLLVDSFFPGYAPRPLNDGYLNDRRLDWTKIAWASAENNRDHWVIIDFGEVKDFNEIRIYWALDGNKFWASKNFTIQKLENNEWVDIKAITNNPQGEELTTIILDEVAKAQIRIFQTKGNGPESRPNLMWISEIEIY